MRWVRCGEHQGAVSTSLGVLYAWPWACRLGALCGEPSRGMAPRTSGAGSGQPTVMVPLVSVNGPSAGLTVPSVGQGSVLVKLPA
jgi:hypothetical protein